MAKKEQVRDDLGASEVQSRMDEFTAQGFRGTKVDPTPNENYTVAGVTSGAPTPETDEDAEAEARDASGIGQGPLAAARLEAEAIEDAAADED
jgi:hypothetical protein